MTMESFATPYPVIFYDGETENEKGHVGIHSVLSFKRFQSQLSRLINVPANQLSTVFVCRRTLKDTAKRQKLPINETTNFNIILNQHNPSKEKDCHFLVSIKKSKKERKGTRKRNNETENIDDEDSTSSGGGISPSDERPHSGIVVDKAFSAEATSPTSILQRPVSPALSTSETVDEQTIQGIASETKNDISGSADKVERILLRREGTSQNKIVNPRLPWPIGRPGQRVEGFNVNDGDTLSLQSLRASATMQDQFWKPEKAWMQEGAVGMPFDRMTLHPMQPPLMPSTCRPEFLRPGRFSDSSLPQGFGMRPVTQMQRFGNLNLQPSFPDVHARPIFSSFENPGNFIHRSSTIPPMPFNVNTSFHQGQLHSLMMQTHTPFKPFPVIALPKSNGVDYAFTQVILDPRLDSETGTYHCVICSARDEGSPVPFHFCVNDKIVSRRRGPCRAGPISRPRQCLNEAIVHH